MAEQRALSLVADEVGVMSPPVTPVLWVVLTVVGAVVQANLVAAQPGWRAARQPTADAPRAE